MIIFRSSNISKPLDPEVYPKPCTGSFYMYTRKAQADADGIYDAVKLLRGSHSPLIIAGNKIHGSIFDSFEFIDQNINLYSVALSIAITSLGFKIWG